jgi:hypothetical protein
MNENNYYDIRDRLLGIRKIDKSVKGLIKSIDRLASSVVALSQRVEQLEEIVYVKESIL